MPENESTTNLEEKFVDTGNGKIFYYIDKSFSGRPMVVFLHGLSANHTTWGKAVKFLRGHRYNTLTLDLRGHGLSDKTKKKSLYAISRLTEDLNLITQKEDIGRFFLIGYSFGGSIAIDYAIKHSDSLLGLILVSANHTNPWRYKGIWFLTPLVYGFLNLLSFLLLWQKRKKYYYYRQGKSRNYWHSVWLGLSTMPLSVNFWMLSQMGKIDFRKTANLIKVPTLIIRAKNDYLLSKSEAEEMVKVIPNAKIVIPEHSSHFLASRAQEELIRIILDFIKKHENSHL